MLELPEGEYEYKFHTKGEWMTDCKKEINKNGNHVFTIDKADRSVYQNL